MKIVEEISLLLFIKNFTGVNMSKISYIKNASQTEAWLAVYYLYNFANNLNKIPSEYDSIQELFLSLVNRFNLTDHLSNILSKGDFLFLGNTNGVNFFCLTKSESFLDKIFDKWSVKLKRLTKLKNNS